jgi:ABC-type branched-subunit amino acid transport system permease subunit
MTLAAALVFDLAVFPRPAVSQSSNGLALKSRWVGLGLFDPNGHAYFVLSMIVLTAVTLSVLQIRKGTVGRFLAALRGSEVAAAGIGINPSRQRVLVFALSGAVAGIGGTLYSLQQAHVTANVFNYQLSLAFVVIVITTGVSTVEGAIQAGIGLTVTEQLVTYLPGRFGGTSLVFVLFAFGALTYAAHPEGVLEFQRRTWTGRFDRLMFPPDRGSPPKVPVPGAADHG